MLIVDQLKKSDPRLRVMAMGVFACMLLLAGGLWYHQVLASRQYVDRLNTQSFRTIRVPAIRGKILDRNGTSLAENRPSYNVNLYLNELRGRFREKYDALKKQQLAAMAATNAPVAGKTPPLRLSRAQIDQLNLVARYHAVNDIVQEVARLTGQPLQLDPRRLQQHYDSRLALPLTIMANLTMEQIAVFQEKSVTAPGLGLEIQSARFYPLKSTGAHVLGYLQRSDSSGEDEDMDFSYRLPDFRGQIGIEAAFDDALRGTPGAKSLLVNNFGYRQGEFILAEPVAGKNVHLTLDADLQRNVENALMHNGPTTRGSAIVMDANTGDILAMASSPTYDLNLSVGGFSREEWARIDDQTLKPGMNRATKEIYSPGSIFKIIIGLAALEAGLNPAEIYRNEGTIRVGRLFHDTAPPGDYNFRRAFIKSSNTYFIFYGLRTGLDKITELAARFHLGERTQLPVFQEEPGNLPTPDWYKRKLGGYSSGNVANICIGQGELNVTPIQMAVMTAAIGNGGKVYWPRIVERIEPQEDQPGIPARLFPPAQLRDEIHVSPRSLDILRDAMIGDIEDPSATAYDAFHPGGKFAVPGLRIGGKTGTAQVQDQKGKVVDHNTWFVSFGQSDKRLYVVTVMIESGGSGGGTCAPIARQIYQKVREWELKPAKVKPGQLAEAGR